MNPILESLSQTDPLPKTTNFIKWFREITIAEVPLVGGKNASLGEMVRELSEKGVKVPDGFAITAEAYRYFLRVAGLNEHIQKTLADLNTHDMSISARAVMPYGKRS